MGLAGRNVLSAVASSPFEPVSSAQVAARFRRTRPERVQPLLDTLAAMSLVRFVESEGVYAA